MIYRFASIVCPRKIYQPQQIVVRRMQALKDMYAAVNHAAMWAAIMQPIGFTDGRLQIIVSGVFVVEIIITYFLF